MKLQAGEYVSLGKVEAELKTCSVVENICVYGDSSKQFTVALVVPNQKHLEDLASRHGITGLAFEELCASPVVEKAVIKELAEHAKKCKCFSLLRCYVGCEFGLLPFVQFAISYSFKFKSNKCAIIRKCALIEFIKLQYKLSFLYMCASKLQNAVLFKNM